MKKTWKRQDASLAFFRSSNLILMKDAFFELDI